MRRPYIRLIGAGLILLAAGCASPKFKPSAYKAAQDRFGAIALPAGAPVCVCPVIDKLSPEARKGLAADFTPWVFVTEALEAELKAAGASTRRPAFSFGPDFLDLQKAIREHARPEDRAVYLGTELWVLSPTLWILDAQILSPRGELLFAKRALCSVWGYLKVDEQQLVHMTLRQILADPRFKAALQ